MSMKSNLGLLAMAAAMMGGGYAENSNPLRPEDIDVVPKEPPIPKGCKKYTFKESFGTLEVIAINEKSAMKKYNKWCNLNQKDKNNHPY
jgi:hypothetical protein